MFKYCDWIIQLVHIVDIVTCSTISRKKEITRACLKTWLRVNSAAKYNLLNVISSGNYKLALNYQNADNLFSFRQNWFHSSRSKPSTNFLNSKQGILNLQETVIAESKICHFCHFSKSRFLNKWCFS